MADYKQYDPGKTVLIYQGHIIKGFASGTFITAERDNDSFTDEVGADGNVTRIKSHDKRGTITLTLMGESESNTVLSTMMVSDELAGLSFGNLELSNLNTTVLIAAADAWIMKPAKYEAADTTSPREWSIRCASLEMFLGGAIV